MFEDFQSSVTALYINFWNFGMFKLSRALVKGNYLVRWKLTISALNKKQLKGILCQVVPVGKTGTTEEVHNDLKFFVRKRSFSEVSFASIPNLECSLCRFRESQCRHETLKAGVQPALPIGVVAPAAEEAGDLQLNVSSFLVWVLIDRKSPLWRLRLKPYIML